MGSDREFITKFNELDAICQKIYPNQKGGFKAIRTFGVNALNKDDKETLLNLIKARNMYSHDQNNLIHFDFQAIKFVQGLIDGANRRYYNNQKGRIDSDLENLRTKNLNIMSSMLNKFDQRYRILNNSDRSRFKNRLNQYIQQERQASGLEAIKDAFFSFKNYYDNVKNSDEYRSEVNNIRERKRERYERNFASEKNKSINAVEAMFMHYIASLGMFQISKKRKAKDMQARSIAMIKRCTNFDTLEDTMDDIEDAFDEMDEDYDYDD